MFIHKVTEFKATETASIFSYDVDSVKFDGPQISKDGLRPFQTNVEALLNIEATTNMKEVHSFHSPQTIT